MFPVFHENFLLHENDANTRANQIQKYLEKLINSKQYQTNQIVVSIIIITNSIFFFYNLKFVFKISWIFLIYHIYLF